MYFSDPLCQKPWQDLEVASSVCMRSFPAHSIFPCLHSGKRRRQTSREAASPGVGFDHAVQQWCGQARCRSPSHVAFSTVSHQAGCPFTHHYRGSPVGSLGNSVSEQHISVVVCIKSKLISTPLRQVCETMEGKK